MAIKQEAKATVHDLVRINVLEDEIQYLKNHLYEADTGFIYTTITTLETRVQSLKGEKVGWPFD
jgi:hypothetical protein